MLLDVAVLAVLVALWVAFTAWPSARAELLSFKPPRRAPPPPEKIEVVPVSWKAYPPSGELEVKGWYVRPLYGAVVILGHGSLADRAHMSGELKILADAGFGVLAFDWPGHGESGGEVKLGEPERQAYQSAVDWLLQQEIRPERIGVLGVSNGAAMLVSFAANDARVTALAAAGGYTDSLEQTTYEFGRTWPWARAAALLVVRWKAEGGNFRPIDLAPGWRRRPSLFITCEKDPVVPPRMSEALAAAAGGELYRLPCEGHANYVENGGRAYADKLVDFFTAALLPGRRR